MLKRGNWQMELKLQIMQRHLWNNNTLLLLPLPLHQQWPPTSVSTSSSPFSNPNSNDSPFHLLRDVHTKYRRWDSNAETFRAQNFNFNPQNDDEDNKDDDVDETQEWFEVLEELIDGAWIIPVFRSFGWMLPAIISSLLLTSGPKAFLMALALPLGQSAFSLAFQKMWGKKPSKSKRKPKTRRKQRAPRSARNVKLEEEEAVKREGTTKGPRGYQTWVAGDDVRDYNDSNSSPIFGGWDELDRETPKKTAHNADEPKRNKLSRKERGSETPLLLRLLIAVFPFLGTWTKIF